jgi:ArsR family metal-binding transcriptional regulator
MKLCMGPFKTWRRALLLKGYHKEIFRPECNQRFQSLHCIAHLDSDISHVLPYLNSELGGFQYIKDPPSVTFKVHGKLITVHSQQIAINALKDEAEADRILDWLKREINETWEQSLKFWNASNYCPRQIVANAVRKPAWSLPRC